MEILDYRFLGHHGPLPMMTPGGLDPSDTITVTSITFFGNFQEISIFETQNIIEKIILTCLSRYLSQI